MQLIHVTATLLLAAASSSGFSVSSTASWQQQASFASAPIKPNTGRGYKRQYLSWTPTQQVTLPAITSPSVCLRSSENDDDETSSESGNDDSVKDDGPEVVNKVEGRKSRVILGYKISSAIYLALGLATYIPGIVRPSQMMAIAANYAAGPVLAASVAFLLVGAADNDRLSSDTYKRLNLFLAKYGFLWLVAAVLVRQTSPLTRGAKIVSNPIVVLASLSAMVNGIKGWAYGVKGWDMNGTATFRGDLVDMVKRSLKILKPIKLMENNTATAYLASTLLVVGMKLTKLVAGIQMVAGKTGTAAKLGALAMAYAKLALLSAVTLTLKDAADRGRLHGTTFIRLNWVSSLTLLSMGAFLVKESQVPLGYGCVVASAFTLYTGVKSYLDEKNKA